MDDDKSRQAAREAGQPLRIDPGRGGVGTACHAPRIAAPMAGSAPLRPDQPTEVATLIAHLGAGGLAVLPTDTVPGLAAEITQPGAADRLAEAKSSTPGRPFSLHLRSEQELRALVPAPPPGMAAWLAHHLPGPWTVVLPRSSASGT